VTCEERDSCAWQDGVGPLSRHSLLLTAAAISNTDRTTRHCSESGTNCMAVTKASVTKVSAPSSWRPNRTTGGCGRAAHRVNANCAVEVRPTP
jgi:hypothetical protein